MAYLNDPDIAQLLLQHKAEVNAREPVLQNTLLHETVNYGTSETARLLLAYKADFNLTNSLSDSPMSPSLIEEWHKLLEKIDKLQKAEKDEREIKVQKEKLKL